MARDLIPPELRSRLRELRIASRRTSPLRGGGAHRSRDKGAGLEFSQYRGYEPGDELRRIDWKLYARSDRFFVREAERDSPLTVWLVLDGSASMTQADEARPDWSRLDAARALAGAIAEVAVRQGDRVGLAVLREDGLQLVQPAGGARHRDRLLFALERAEARGELPDEPRLRPLSQRIGADDMVVMVGDCFDERFIAFMVQLARSRREVACVQVLTVAEHTFPFDDGRVFRDPETGQQLPGDGRSLRAGFLARFTQAQRVLHARLDAVGIRHATHVLGAPLAPTLLRLFPAQGGSGQG